MRDKNGTRYTYEIIREVINKTGNTLVSTEYIKNTKKLQIRCKCGEIYETSFVGFKGSGKNKPKQSCDYCTGKKKRNKICTICGSEYKPHRKTQEFCSVECRAKSREKRYDVKCDNCGKEIVKKQHEIDRNKHHYCSQECRMEHQKITMLGSNNPNYGNKGLFVGEKSPRWNSNLTNEDRIQRRHILGYEEWKNQVKIRDNYTCTHCGKRGGDMHSHHLNSYHWDIEGRADINNGVTLCEVCHKEFHSIYGNKNNTKEQFYEWNNKY